LEDFVLSMPRGATIVYPKDAAEIIAFGDIHSGDHVLEAGVGSGALTISLLRAVGTSGRVLSIERREDFGTIAAKNISLFFGSAHPAWELQINSFQDAVLDEKFDRVVLDMLAPWDCIEITAQILRPGGVFIGYVTTTTQLSRLVEALRANTLFTEPESWESLHRPWHVESLSVRPEHRMISHTGFLVRSRRVADGVSAMRKRRRPSKPDEDDLLDQD
jgi:tRNA (adenine57-N1/adenine58-N1)-methyltransferase catalytic subunit